MKTAHKPKNNQNIDTLKQKRKNRAKKIAITIAICLVALPLVALGLFVGGYAIWANSVEIDTTLLPTETSVPTLYYLDGSQIEYTQSDYILPSDVPKNLKNAFVAIEDKRFYSHKGYDVWRIGGAMLKNISVGTMKEGASTITQQLVKNTHLSSERTISRKLKEIAIAAKLEKQYSKDEIMSMYLSVIYFGSGAYGARQAARVYFDKSVEDLTLSECATLAGIVKNPRDYSPLNNKTNALERRNLTLSLMREQNLISDDELSRARNENLIVKGKTLKNFSDKSGETLSYHDCKLYIDKVIDEVCSTLEITKYQLGNSGMKIYTHLDKDLQLQLKNQTYNSANFSNEEVLCSSVIVNSQTGAVCAYHSSLDYEVKRQAGSTLKPLAVYAPAIDMGCVSLATPIVDEKVDFQGYSPSNYGDVYYGDTTIKNAICKSMNSVAVKTINYVGIENSVYYLEKFGISLQDDDKNYALSLGATKNGVTPLNLANAYSTLARCGEYLQANFVRFVVDGGIKINFENRQKTRVVKPSTASLMSVALVDTVKNGTAKGLCYLPFELASKTGTAERENGTNADAWSLSYNDDYTLAVWHGSDGALDEKGGSYPTRHAANVWQGIDGVKQLSKSIALSSDIVKIDVDTYSTNANKQVTIASQNTPLEYRKSEYFDIANLPNATRSRFDFIDACKLRVSNKNGVEISFDTEEIFDYTLYRTDVFGENVIASFCGENCDSVSVNADGTNQFFMRDTPISFDKVKYRLHVQLKGNPQVFRDEEIEIYIKNEFVG